MTDAPQVPAEIKAPIRVFLHPDTGSRVTCLGTIHAAQPAYYSALTEIIAGIEQARGTIYFEQIQPPAPSDLDAAPEWLRWGAEAVRKKLDSMSDHATDAGLTLQKKALPRKDTWQVHDVTTLRAAEVYGEQEMRRQDEQRQQTEYFFSSMTADLRRAVLLQSLVASVKVVTGEVPVETVLPTAERELAAMREAVVFAALDRQRAAQPDAHIATVWGAAHLVGFTAALEQRGYKTDDERWITAIDTRAE